MGRRDGPDTGFAVKLSGICGGCQNGDGRRDIWGSIPDVMASTANFLASSGWKAGQPWGLEVTLPPGFDYARAV